MTETPPPQQPGNDPGNWGTPPPGGQYSAPPAGQYAQPGGQPGTGEWGGQAPSQGWGGPPPKSNRRRTILLIAGGVVAVLVVLAIIGAIFGDKSGDKSKNQKSASATRQSNGTSQVDSQGVKLSLPKGWQAVPLTPDKFRQFLDRAAKGNPSLRRSLTSQIEQGTSQNVKLFAVKTATLESGATTNVTVITVPNAGTPDLNTLGQTGKSQLEGAGATVDDPKPVTLSHGKGVRLDYLLSVNRPDGSVLHAQGEQIYAELNGQIDVVTLTSGNRQTDQADFDAMLSSLDVT